MDNDTPPALPALAENQIRLKAKGAKVGKVFTLTLPDFTTRLEVRGLTGQPQRILAAALAVCCPQVCRMLRDKDVPHSRGPTLKGCDYNLKEFGGVVLNGLHEKGVPTLDIIRAGDKAWDLINASFVPQSDVDEAEGNSEEGEDG
jgi:hypothetical protein